MAKTSGGVRGNTKAQSKVAKTLKVQESSIRRNKYETAVAIDGSGKIIVNKKGGARSVEFTPEEVSKMKDAVFTHNHPSALGKRGIGAIGSSFSWQDMKTMVKANMKEMRAVTPTYTFSIKRPKNGWGVSDNKIKKSYDSIKAGVDREMIKYLNERGWSSTALERANIVAIHKIAQKMSKKFGWIYSKHKG